MNQYEFILGIVIVIMIASVIKAGLRGSRHREEAPPPAPETNRLQDEVRTLKDRIAVLERIATDKESTLEREIERLRDR